MNNIEDLRETAALAHLNLGDGELRGAFPAFEQMLGYFAVMQGADSDREAFPEKAPEGRVVTSAHFRDDSPAPEAPGQASGPNERLLSNSGDRDGPFVVIPNVL